MTSRCCLIRTTKVRAFRFGVRLTFMALMLHLILITAIVAEADGFHLPLPISLHLKFNICCRLNSATAEALG